MRLLPFLATFCTVALADHDPNWTEAEVQSFLKGFGESAKWSHIADVFAENKLDGSDLKHLNSRILMEMGISEIHSLSLLEKIGNRVSNNAEAKTAPRRNSQQRSLLDNDFSSAAQNQCLQTNVQECVTVCDAMSLEMDTWYQGFAPCPEGATRSQTGYPGDHQCECGDAYTTEVPIEYNTETRQFEGLCELIPACPEEVGGIGNIAADYLPFEDRQLGAIYQADCGFGSYGNPTIECVWDQDPLVPPYWDTPSEDCGYCNDVPGCHFTALNCSTEEDHYCHEPETNCEENSYPDPETGSCGWENFYSEMLTEEEKTWLYDTLLPYAGEGHWKLVYQIGRDEEIFAQTQRDGITVADWHAKVDGDYKTVVLGQINASYGAYIIGGYSSMDWGQGGYGTSDYAGLISMRYSGNMWFESSGSYNMYGYSEYGPTWGGGHDMAWTTSGSSYSMLDASGAYCNPYSYSGKGWSSSYCGGYSGWNFDIIETWKFCPAGEQCDF